MQSYLSLTIFQSSSKLDPAQSKSHTNSFHHSFEKTAKMVLVGGLRTAALAFFALAACVKADFSVFYGSLDGYGVSGYYWFFMNTVPAAW